MIVNIWGSPGAGKSYFMAQLFLEFKNKHYRTVMHPEPPIIQRMVDSGNWNVDLINRLINDQFECMRDLELSCGGIVQVTDHPVAIGSFYRSNDALWDLDKSLRDFDVYDVWVERGNREYNNVGRQQNMDESDLLSKCMYDTLCSRNIELIPASNAVRGFIGE